MHINIKQTYCSKDKFLKKHLIQLYHLGGPWPENIEDPWPKTSSSAPVSVGLSLNQCWFCIDYYDW